MSDREHAGLRGPVRSCGLDRTWYSGNCQGDACERTERHDSMATEFREDGQLAAQRGRNHDGSEWTRRFEYDDAGRLTLDSGAGLTRRHEYDSAGRRIGIVSTDASGRERLAERFEYDAAGRLTIVQHLDVSSVADSGCSVHYCVGGSDVGYPVADAATIVTRHDERGGAIEVRFVDASDTDLARVTFARDDAGHVLEETMTRTDLGLPRELLAELDPAQLQSVRALMGAGGEPVRHVHRYDDRGRRIETRDELFGPLGRDTRWMAYNDHDDQVEEIRESVHRNANFGERGELNDDPGEATSSRSEARFLYEYDDHGNWTRKVVEGRGNSTGAFTISSIEQRVLTYYSD